VSYIVYCGQVDEGDDEQQERQREHQRDPVAVIDAKERADEGDDQERGRAQAAQNRKEDCVIEKDHSPGMQRHDFRRLCRLGRTQSSDVIDDSLQSGNQNAEKGGYGAKHERWSGRMRDCDAHLIEIRVHYGHVKVSACEMPTS
jgi:hypothetical protein